MFEIDFKSRKSIYEQVIDGIKADIMACNYGPGVKLPSVRDLSAKLTVNPNTIQKAYRELENQGWIYTVSGLGCFVSEEERPKNEKELAALYDQLSETIKQLRYLGETEEVILEKIRGGNEQ